MKKKVGNFAIISLVLIFLFASLIFNLNFVSSVSIDSEIQKLTRYAEDFEIGNIDYVKLLVYSSAVREAMNNVLGTTSKERGGILKEGQLRAILGEPTETTKWTWLEDEQREIKLDKEASVWRKIIFDGRKIQIWINSWPSAQKKSGENVLVYRLNFEFTFKEAKNELNVEGKITEIKALAETFSKDPSRSNAETLAKESVNVEKTFQMYSKQSAGKCEDIMNSIFGSESKKSSQKMLVDEITFYEGANFEVIAKLEMCDDCEWKWVNLNMWINGRGSGFRMPKEQPQDSSPEQYKNMDVSEYKRLITEALAQAKADLEQGDYGKIRSMNSRIQAINEAWNQKTNDVWKEVDNMYKNSNVIVQDQQAKQDEYWWIKQDQEKQMKVKEITDKSYQERRDFYLSLFSGYDKKEFYFSQTQYEKRLVEEFLQFGREICNNNIDDNKNEKIDCSDDQCQGKKCGKQKISVGNGTAEIEQDLFCIEGTCQLREELKVEENKTICGNHVCETEEMQNCKQDCNDCIIYGALNCSGKVIFKGMSAEGCPLEPICLFETDSCGKNEDCIQPLCGKSECVEGKCKTMTLEECKEAECGGGTEKVMNCDDGEKIVSEICQEGAWRKTGAECKTSGGETNGTIEIPIVIEDPIPKTECNVKEDCGNENDVCSNGKCVTIPEVIKEPEPEIIIESPKEEPKETPPSQEQTPAENNPAQENQQTQEQQPAEQQTSQEPVPQTEQQAPASQPEPSPASQEETQSAPVTGGAIAFLESITGKITGLITGFVISITGREVESAPAPQESAPAPEPAPPQPSSDNPQPPTGGDQPQQQPQDNQNREIRNDNEQRDNQNRADRERENQDRQRQDRERRERECKDNCDRECKNSLVNQCVGECVRTSTCKDTTCVDSEIQKCEADCKQKTEFDKCVGECEGKCLNGENTQMQMEEPKEQKMEKGVFQAGGTCRNAQGSQKAESFIFFGGWGDPFEQIQSLKQKYYNGGEADWCKTEFENLLKQRRELEKGLNQEFAAWFFEKYLANSADEWEQHVSGIFEIYQKDVELSRQIAERMNCLEMSEMPSYNLINIKYETDFGKLEFWEEIKTAKLFGSGNPTQVISPYMKVWIFPPKSFIVYEMKTAMKNHEFPGSPEDKMERANQEGPTAEEREMIKQDKGFMNQIKAAAEKYNGNVNAVIRFVDNGSVIFNLYAQINENDIIKMEPMLPEEVPEEDVIIEIDFQKIYDMIYIQEKEMRGERTESPPWDQKMQPVQKIKETVSGVKMYFKMRDLMNSAKISPANNEKEVRSLMKLFFNMMQKEGNNKGMQDGNDKENQDMGAEKGVWEDKGKITGEIISG